MLTWLHMRLSQKCIAVRLFVVSSELEQEVNLVQYVGAQFPSNTLKNRVKNVKKKKKKQHISTLISSVMGITVKGQ